MDGCDHPSRQGWPDRRRPPEIEATPVLNERAIPTWGRLLIASALLLTIAVAMLLYYVFGRSEYRDEQAAMQDERFRIGICDVLSSLPEDQLLDTLRFKYHCGPGIPLRDLPEIYGDQDLTNVQIPEE